MATQFKGMSQSNFLDGLVTQTGKNGHELYDYLIQLIKQAKLAMPKNEVKPNLEDRIVTFTGSRDEMCDYIALIGGERNNSYVSDYALAVYAAKLLKVKGFKWRKPAIVRSNDGTEEIVVREETAILNEFGELTI